MNKDNLLNINKLPRILSDSVGIRESAVFYSKILCFTILFVSG